MQPHWQSLMDNAWSWTYIISFIHCRYTPSPFVFTTSGKLISEKNVVPNEFKLRWVAGSKTVTCSVLTDKQTNRQTNKKAKTEAALSGLSEFLTSAHHQGAVQLWITLQEVRYSKWYLKSSRYTFVSFCREVRCMHLVHLFSLHCIGLY